MGVSLCSSSLAACQVLERRALHESQLASYPCESYHRTGPSGDAGNHRGAASITDAMDRAAL